MYKNIFTLSRELLFSPCLSGRLFPESVLIRDPLESAFLTQLTFGVEEVYGVAGEKSKKKRNVFLYPLTENYILELQVVKSYNIYLTVKLTIK